MTSVVPDVGRSQHIGDPIHQHLQPRDLLLQFVDAGLDILKSANDEIRVLQIFFIHRDTSLGNRVNVRLRPESLKGGAA